MSKEINFVYFLDGKEVTKDSINWESNITVRVKLNEVYITSVIDIAD
jgi:hypothetical protein